MANLKNIRRRINLVTNTQQITQAMKLVAASRFRRAHEDVLAARPYAEKLHQVLSSLALREDEAVHPLLGRQSSERALLLVMTSDRGLCGGFNMNIIKMVERFVEENAAGFAAYDLMIIGRKGKDYFTHHSGHNIVKIYEGVTSKASYGVSSLLGQEVVAGFCDRAYDGAYLFFNAFRSAICQQETVVQLLPIVPRETMVEENVVCFIYEPDRRQVLESILPKYVEVEIYRAFVESLASEHGARMSAMDSASKNATQMIQRLTLQYNRMRQAAITKELSEIISGAESV